MFDEDTSSEEVRHIITSSEEVRRRIERNDPDLVDVTIRNFDCLPHHDGWERFGESVGKNTHLRELTMTGADITKEDMEKFFHGVAHNRSIRKLSLGYGGLFDGELFNIMVPFFKNNGNFECLELDCCRLKHVCLHSFVSALAKFDSLKELNFCCHIDNDDEAREIIQALTGH